MRATTTELVHRIWSSFYAEKAAEEAKNGLADEVNANEEIKEVEDEENEEQEEETILAGNRNRSRGVKSPLGKRKAAVKVEWEGKTIGKNEKGEALYAKAVVNGNSIRVGGAVALGEEGGVEDVLPEIVVVQFLYEGKRGERMLHGRVLERGGDTVLGNAANERELFLVDRSAVIVSSLLHLQASSKCSCRL
jgi:DNA (cytosine-5)-methyltransferase 1